MTTYNSYQEAKLAMPLACIIEDTDSGLFFGMPTREGTTLAGGSRFAEPQYYCISMLTFSELGRKLVDGDVYQNEDGRVFTVGNLGYEARYCNLLSSYCFPSKVFILRAAALENIPTETPEEKEVLDSIESAGEVEWKNGDECVYMSHKVIHQFIGADPKREGYGYIQATGYEVNFVELSKLSKPETPHHREERERLEAGYELYKTCGIQHETVSFNEWVDDYKDVWLNIVDKTNYRKEKSHGAN